MFFGSNLVIARGVRVLRDEAIPNFAGETLALPGTARAGVRAVQMLSRVAVHSHPSGVQGIL